MFKYIVSPTKVNVLWPIYDLDTGAIIIIFNKVGYVNDQIFIYCDKLLFCLIVKYEYQIILIFFIIQYTNNVSFYVNHGEIIELSVITNDLKYIVLLEPYKIEFLLVFKGFPTTNEVNFNKCISYNSLLDVIKVVFYINNLI